MESTIASCTHQRTPWIGRLGAGLRKRLLLKLLPLHHRAIDDTFVRYIVIEVVRDGHTIRKAAIALFDTGCPETLMSRKLAETLGFSCPSGTGKPILESLCGGQVITMGQVAGRWACGINPSKSRLALDPRHYDGVWEVSGNQDDRYDVIFGRDMIVKYGLLGFKPKLAAPASYITSLPQVDKVKARVALEKQQEEKRKDDEEIQRHQRSKTEKDAQTYTSNQKP